MNIINNIKSRVNTAIKETAGNIYQELEEYSQISQDDINTILDTENIKIAPEYNEIEFFYSNDGKQKTIYDIFSENLSITGKWYLRTLLSNHITDIKELTNRQNFIVNINSLNNNKSNNTYININTLITNNKDLEKSVYWFIKPHNPELSEMLNSIYFTKVANMIDLKKINDTEKFMNYYYTFLMIISPLWGMLSPVFFFIMPFFFTKYFLKLPMKFADYLKTLKATLFGDNIFNTIKAVLMMFMAKQIGGDPDAKVSFFKRIQILFVQLIYMLVSSPYIRYIYLLFVIIGYIWSLFTSYSVSRNYYKFIKFLHNRLKSIHLLVTNTSNLHSIISSMDVSNLPTDITDSLQKVSAILNQDTIKELYSQQTKQYFNASYNIFSNKGTVLSLYHKISNYINSNDILTLVKFNSMVETYVNFSSVTGFTKHFNKVNYIDTNINTTTNINIKNTENNKPQLSISDMFNPVCGGFNNCISNSINLVDDIINEEFDDNIIKEINSNTDNTNELELETDNNAETNDEYKESDNKEEKSDNEEEKSDNEVVLEQQNHPSSGYKNMILTGPNGSGKSTFLKTIMMSVILAQTIGWVPASSMTITPFTYLSTYLNIPDCTGKESLFQAEMNRCHNHLLKLKDLDTTEGKYSFNIMDEIFVSTNYYEGISGAWAVMKNVVKYNNAVNIITTHFDKCIENPINGYIYKHFTLSDELENDYKLRDGINRKHCALNLLEKYGFDAELVLEAKNKYSEITI